MRDVSQNRKLVMQGPYVPVPASPFWNIYDFWSPLVVSSKLWTYTIPPDDMVYTICNFTVASLPNGYMIAAFSINDVVAFSDYTGYQIKWSPGSEKGPKLKAGDKIDVAIVHSYNYQWNYYWQIDMFRDPV
jgi:hypothetical protein